jgi:lipopolysaccharide transport system permease protein
LITGAHQIGLSGKVYAALLDIRDGIANYHVWGLLGWQDIRQRYRRSVIGPFWLTLSTAIMVGTIGFLYARLLGQPVDRYLPHLAVGLIVWGSMVATVSENCLVFIAAEQIIKQVRLPLTTHVCRVVWRNAIIFAHNSIILVLVAFWTGNVTSASLLSVPFALMALVVNGLWIGLMLGVLCARFRDIPQIITNLMQIAFFVTPILYRPEILGNRAWVADFNPLHHLIEVIRAPIIGAGVPAASWAFVLAFTLAGSLLAILLLARYRSRVPYWI